MPMPSKPSRPPVTCSTAKPRANSMTPSIRPAGGATRRQLTRPFAAGHQRPGPARETRADEQRQRETLTLSPDWLRSPPRVPYTGMRHPADPRTAAMSERLREMLEKVLAGAPVASRGRLAAIYLGSVLGLRHPARHVHAGVVTFGPYPSSARSRSPDDFWRALAGGSGADGLRVVDRHRLRPHPRGHRAHCASQLRGVRGPQQQRHAMTGETPSETLSAADLEALIVRALVASRTAPQNARSVARALAAGRDRRAEGSRPQPSAELHGAGEGRQSRRLRDARSPRRRAPAR